MLSILRSRQMAIKVADTLYSKLPKQVGVVSSMTGTANQIIFHDTTNGRLSNSATARVNSVTLAGILTENVASAATEAEFIPLDNAIFCVVDCVANSASNQLHKRHVLGSDFGTVANTSTDVASTAGVFFALRQVGTATDKKLYGYFVKLGQVAIAT